MKMKSAEKIGLAFLSGGILLLIIYGLYNADLSEIDPVVLAGILGMFLGIIILIISTITARRGKEMENITKEDLRP